MFDQQNDQHMLCQNVVQASFAQHLGRFGTTYVEWTGVQMLSGFASTSGSSSHNICCAKLVFTQHLLCENVDPNVWNNILINISQSLLSSVLNVVQSPDVDPKCWSMWFVRHFTQHNYVVSKCCTIWFVQHFHTTYVDHYLDQHDVDRFQNTMKNIEFNNQRKYSFWHC